MAFPILLHLHLLPLRSPVFSPDSTYSNHLNFHCWKHIEYAWFQILESYLPNPPLFLTCLFATSSGSFPWHSGRDDFWWSCTSLITSLKTSHQIHYIFIYSKTHALMIHVGFVPSKVLSNFFRAQEWLISIKTFVKWISRGEWSIFSWSSYG